MKSSRRTLAALCLLLAAAAVTPMASLAAAPTGAAPAGASALQEHGAPAWTWERVEAELLERVEKRHFIPMRDGVRLDGNVYFPKAGEAPYPTVLIRSQYPIDSMMKMQTEGGFVPLALRNGYVVVYVNERGRYWSEGEYIYLGGAKTDGYDTIEWIVGQEWSNGKVGTYGCSSSAEQQLGMSVSNHPAHAAAIAAAPGAGIGWVGPYAEQGNTYRGGALTLLFANWNREFLYYGGTGSRIRPQFPPDLTREERVRASEIWRLTPEYGFFKDADFGPDDWIQEGFDYEAMFEHLPIRELTSRNGGPVTSWDDLSTRTPMDPAWAEHGFANEGDTFGAPMLWLFSWYDVGVVPNVALFNWARDHTASERAAGNQFMLVSPVAHCAFGSETGATIVGERNVGDARFDYEQLYVDWLDHWVKGEANDVLDMPTVRFYDMGEQAWKEDEVFPPTGTEMRDLYLSSDEGANSRFGDGRLSFDPPSAAGSDSYLYDPEQPVPTLGGGACCMGDHPGTFPGSYDQSEIQLRHDVLVYTSEVLGEDLAVSGFVEAELWVSSSAPDTDFTVKLVDVDPDGKAWNLDDTIFRARYREGWENDVRMEEGGVYKIEITPMVTSNTFKKGHRVRVEISSSNFPRYDRNLNTGGNNWDETEPVKATNVVHHSPEHPSRIRLPVVD
jgi:putative CocE/NonD family hydrolase